MGYPLIQVPVAGEALAYLLISAIATPIMFEDDRRGYVNLMNLLKYLSGSIIILLLLVPLGQIILRFIILALAAMATLFVCRRGKHVIGGADFLYIPPLAVASPPLFMLSLLVAYFFVIRWNARSDPRGIVRFIALFNAVSLVVAAVVVTLLVAVQTFDIKTLMTKMG